MVFGFFILLVAFARFAWEPIFDGSLFRFYNCFLIATIHFAFKLAQHVLGEDKPLGCLHKSKCVDDILTAEIFRAIIQVAGFLNEGGLIAYGGFYCIEIIANRIR